MSATDEEYDQLERRAKRAEADAQKWKDRALGNDPLFHDAEKEALKARLAEAERNCAMVLQMLRSVKGHKADYPNLASSSPAPAAAPPTAPRGWSSRAGCLEPGCSSRTKNPDGYCRFHHRLSRRKPPRRPSAEQTECGS